MTEPSLDQRLVDLESRQAFQDETIAGLNKALVDQQHRIDQLEKALTLVMEQIREADPEIDLSSEGQEPPHY